MTTASECDSVLENLPRVKFSNKLIWGVGVNDSDFQVSCKVNGLSRKHRAYGVWNTMLQRCYEGRVKQYSATKVCGEWMLFSNFFKWWKQYYVEGWSIDKDILTEENIYSPETCIFVPTWINSFITLRNAKRGNYPVGVSYHKKKKVFIASIMENSEKKHLGSYLFADEAHNAWLIAKLDNLRRRKDEIDSIDLRLYPRLIHIITSSK